MKNIIFLVSILNLVSCGLGTRFEELELSGVAGVAQSSSAKGSEVGSVAFIGNECIAKSFTLEDDMNGYFQVSNEGKILLIKDGPVAGIYDLVVIGTCDGQSGQVTVQVTIESITPKLKAKVFLAGAYDTGTSLMKTTLNSRNLLPINHPYTNVFFNHSGTEAVASDFFQVHSNVVDWIIIELRSGLGPNTKVVSKAVLINEEGFLVDINGDSFISFPGLENGDYYVVIRHRNHLDVMSTGKVSLERGVLKDIDFTQALNSVQACQSGECLSQVEVGVWALWSGDCNLDGRIRHQGAGNDSTALYNFVQLHPDNAFGSAGYIISGEYQIFDMNFDGDIIYDNNPSDRDVVLNSVIDNPANIVFGVPAPGYTVEGNNNI